jgi:NADH:ubiquinone oxidoreductase subunit K
VRAMMFLQIAGNIIRKDWLQNTKNIVMFTVGMCIPLFVPEDDIKHGMMAGILVGAAFGYSYFVFTIERARRSLPLLLGLPIRPGNLVTAKYLSLYSMCLVTANLGGVFLRDFRMLYLLNAEVLFLATVFMAAIVIWDHPMAPMVPLFLLALAAQRNTVLKEVTPHLFVIATVALILTPFIAVFSVVAFDKHSSA